MGWLILFLLVAVAAGGLWLLKLRAGLLTAALAALTFGAAGYALQGSPGQDGAPAQGGEARVRLPLTEARHAFFGNFSPEESWMSMAEALGRSGDTENAVGLLQNAVGRYPTDAQLWVGLGNALVDHAQVLTPPAELAFQRAAELSPGHPAAPFFYGLALARSGQREAAVEVWQRLLVDAPPKASWRPLVEAGIVALSRPPPAPTR